MYQVKHAVEPSSICDDSHDSMHDHSRFVSQHRAFSGLGGIPEHAWAICYWFGWSFDGNFCDGLELFQSWDASWPGGSRERSSGIRGHELSRKYDKTVVDRYRDGLRADCEMYSRWILEFES